MTNPLFTSKEAIAHLRISRSTLYALISSGKLVARKVGGSLRFYQSDLDACTQKTHPIKKAPRHPNVKPRTRQMTENTRNRIIRSLVQEEPEEQRPQCVEEWELCSDEELDEAYAYFCRQKIQRIASKIQQGGEA